MSSLFDTPSVNEILALGERLTAAGYDVGPIGPVLAKAATMNDALSAATQPDRHDLSDLINWEPAEAVRHLREAAFIRIAESFLGQVHTGYSHSLARSTRAALHAGSDKLILTMRKQWTPAAAVVKAAADAGLTKDTDPHHLLNNAEPAVIDAYRNLGAAVRTLDEIASLRTDLTRIGGVGPGDTPVAAFVTGVPTPEELATAQTILTGQTRWGDVFDGRFTARGLVPVQRLGGPWLTLINEGYTLRLNTGPEATQVVATANAEQQQPSGRGENTQGALPVAVPA